MRKILTVPTLLLLAVAGGFAAENKTGETWRDIGNGASAAMAATAARASADPVIIPLSGSPVANSYRNAAVGMAVDAHLQKEDAILKPGRGLAEAMVWLGAATSASAAESTALNNANRMIVVAEMGGVIAEDWQGTYALFSLDGWQKDLEPQFALGVAAERLTIGREPVTGAIEAVVRVTVPMILPVFGGRVAVGPSMSGRAGATGDGDLVVGLDLALHTEIAISYGFGATLDLGAGQRATKEAASDIQPSGSVGLAFVF